MYKLPTRQELLDAGCPYGITVEGTPFGREDSEWLRTEPDVVIYTSEKPEESGNEILSVCEVPGKNCLFAVWQQSSVEGATDERILYSKSFDGHIWEKAKFLDGVRPGFMGIDTIASGPAMTVAPSGRIYVFYTKHDKPLLEKKPYAYLRNKRVCVYSDDCGETWSKPYTMPVLKSCWNINENPEDQCLLAIQSPVHLSDGRMLLAYTKFVDPEVLPDAYCGGHLIRNMRVYFMIIENFAESPAPEDFKITWLPDDDKGLYIKGEEAPFSLVEEPFVTELPDGRWFCTLRTMKMCIYYSVSSDKGHTWTNPKPMQFSDGTPFTNPVVTPYIRDVGDGRYMVLYYGRYGTDEQIYMFRDKLYRTFGTFAPEDEQPIRFTEKPELYMEIDVAAGSRKHTAPEINVEGDFTDYKGEKIFWYPDRKHYILGKKI